MTWNIWDIRLQNGKSEPSNPKGHGHLYLYNSDYVLDTAEISSLPGNDGGLQVPTKRWQLSQMWVCGLNRW